MNTKNKLTASSAIACTAAIMLMASGIACGALSDSSEANLSLDKDEGRRAEILSRETPSTEFLEEEDIKTGKIFTCDAISHERVCMPAIGYVTFSRGAVPCKWTAGVVPPCSENKGKPVGAFDRCLEVQPSENECNGRALNKAGDPMDCALTKKLRQRRCDDRVNEEHLPSGCGERAQIFCEEDGKCDATSAGECVRRMPAKPETGKGHSAAEPESASSASATGTEAGAGAASGSPATSASPDVPKTKDKPARTGARVTFDHVPRDILRELSRRGSKTAAGPKGTFKPGAAESGSKKPAEPHAKPPMHVKTGPIFVASPTSAVTAASPTASSPRSAPAMLPVVAPVAPISATDRATPAAPAPLTPPAAPAPLAPPAVPTSAAPILPAAPASPVSPLAVPLVTFPSPPGPPPSVGGVPTLAPLAMKAVAGTRAEGKAPLPSSESKSGKVARCALNDDEEILRVLKDRKSKPVIKELFETKYRWFSSKTKSLKENYRRIFESHCQTLRVNGESKASGECQNEERPLAERSGLCNAQLCKVVQGGAG
jgi:hypothetical protein